MVLYQGFRSRRVPLASWWSVSLCFFASPFYLSCHIYMVSQLERVIFYRVSLLARVIADRVSQSETVIEGFRSRPVPLASWLSVFVFFSSLHLFAYLSCQGVPVRESNVIQIFSVFVEFLVLFSSRSQAVIKRSSNDNSFLFKKESLSEKNHHLSEKFISSKSLQIHN